MPGFNLGLNTLEQEVELENLPVRGAFPAWLSGTLIRNGPGKFEVGEQSFRHWFDGWSMLHRFSIKNGLVSYANKFLQSRDYRQSMAKGRIAMPAFATNPDRTVFQRFSSLFSPALTDNANVSIARIAGHTIAMTETPHCNEFDPHTLETLGAFDYGKDRFPGIMTTAHPHFDFERNLIINYTIQFSRNCRYNVYRIEAGSLQRNLIGSLTVRQPAYMHSFGMTAHYVILVEFPLLANPLGLLLSGKPFIENYRWMPERETRFHLMDKADGSIRSYSGEAVFAFHHVNAYERNGDVFVDIAAYEDNSVIDALYLQGLRAGNPIPSAELRRYHLPARGETADHERLATEAIELPVLNYKRCNAMDYRYCYGISQRSESSGVFGSQLVKIDVKERTAKIWREGGCYPGEPLFVGAPSAVNEDDGILLSVVLDARRGNSFLMALNAASFTELARAEVPHPIPFGFHGQFFAE